MSLTVNALRKLQENGAFPAPKKRPDGESTPESPSLETDAESELPVGEETAEATVDSTPTSIQSGHDHSTPTSELEPPISTEGEREANQALPGPMPLDEEDSSIPTTDSAGSDARVQADTDPFLDFPVVESPKRVYQDQKTIELPLLDSFGVDTPNAQESGPECDPRKIEHPPWPEDGPEHCNIPATDQNIPATDQATEVTLESKGANPDPSLDSEERAIVPAEPVTPHSDSSDDESFGIPANDIAHGPHNAATRDHVSDLGAETVEFAAPLEPFDSADREIEPSITEGIESIEQILQDAHETSNEEATPGLDGPLYTEEIDNFNVPPDATQPIQRWEDAEPETRDPKAVGPPTESLESNDDDAYNPVIQPLYELNSNSDADDRVEETSLTSSATVELETIQAELADADARAETDAPDHRIPAPGTDPEQPAKFDPDIVIASTVDDDPQDEQDNATTAVESAETSLPESAYEIELRESLAKPDVEKQFMHLSNQLYARSQYKLPSSLLLLTPQQTGRIADAVAHLSVALERDGRQVVMLDANLAEQGLTRRFEALGKPGLCDVLTETLHPLDVSLPTANESIRIVPCGDDVTGISRTHNSVEGRTVRNILQTLARDGGIVVCDAGSIQSALALPLAEAFDAVVLVISMQDLKLDIVSEATQILRDRQINLLGCIITDA